MAEVAGKYQTVVTVYNPVSAQIVQLLPLNPKRYYLEIRGETTGSPWHVALPGPILPPNAYNAQTTTPQIYKFADCPSLVTGEFYIFDDGFDQIITIEVIYVGND